MEIPDILRDKRIQTAAISAITFAVGGGIGYILGKKKGLKDREKKRIINETTYFLDDLKRRRLLEREMQETKESKPEEDESNLPPDVRVDRILERQRIREERARARKEEHEESPPVQVFVSPDGDWDYEAELANRTDPKEPYIIHQDEFIADEMDFHQDTLTYYAGDDIMADSDDTPIYNYAGLMGELRFGHGSKDPNVVYIRNEGIHMEWEILRDEGLYSEEVLGLEMENDAESEIQHERSVLKFRPE